VGQPLNLFATYATNATYSWSGPNGFTSSTQNPSITNATTAASGIYTVSVTAAACAPALATTTATVSAMPTASVYGSTTIASNQSATIFATLMGTPGWIVTWSDGVITTNGSSPASRSVSPISNFVYTVTAISDSLCGSGSSSGNATISLSGVAPFVTGSPTNWTACAGDSVTFVVSASGSLPLSYQWRKGGVNLSDGSTVSGATLSELLFSPVATIDNGSTFDVVISNSCGSVTSSPPVTLTVNVSPSAVISKPTDVCPGTTGNTASVPSAGTGATYAWTINNGSITAGQGSNAILWVAGSVNPVILGITIANLSGCTASNSTNVTLDSPPSIASQPTDQVTIVEESVTFSASADGTGPLNYAWRKRDTGWGGGGWSMSSNGGTYAGPFFILGSSTNNGIGGSPQTNIDSNGQSWGVISDTNQIAQAIRPFNRFLLPGQSFGMDFDNGTLATNPAAAVGFSLQDVLGTNRFDFFLGGGQTNYTIRDSTTVNTGIRSNALGLHLLFVLTDSNVYRVAVTCLQDGSTTSFTGTLAGSPTQIINQVRIYSANVGTNLASTLYFNNLRVDTEDDNAAALAYSNGWVAATDGGQSPLTNAPDASMWTITNVNYALAGAYDLVVSGGCTPPAFSSPATLTVDPPDCISGPSLICPNQTVTLCAPSNNMACYLWSGPAMPSGCTSQCVSVNGVGAYTVTMTDSNGVQSLCRHVLTGAFALDTDLIAPDALCTNSPEQVAYVSPTNGIATYQWQITNGLITSSTNTDQITFTVGTADPLTLSVVITGTNGCSTTLTKPVAVTVKDTIPPVVYAPGLVVQPNQSDCTAVVTNFGVTVSDNCPGVSITFSPPAGSTFSQGVTLVTWIATDASGNSVSNYFTLDVAIPSAQIFVANAVCAGSISNIASAPAAPSGLTYGYTWSIANGTIDFGQHSKQIIWSAGPTGTVSISVNVSNSVGCTASNTTAVTIVSQPVVSIAAPLHVCGNTTGHVAWVQDFGPETQYGWSVSNGTISAGQNTPTLTWNAGPAGPIQISLEVANGAQCSYSTSAVVEVPCVDISQQNGPPQGTNGPFCQTYTTDADFDQGVSLGVQHNLPEHNQLQLLKNLSFPYVWVPASGRGTVIKIDVNTAAILGEYWSAPNGTDTWNMAKNPSRTTVDRLGNVWVGNRDEQSAVNGQPEGSVVRIGVVQGGVRYSKVGTNYVADPFGQYLKGPFDYCTCIDRDGDGYIRTSTGLGDVLDWSNPNALDSTGGVRSADDECIINYTRVISTGTRTLAVDANNDLWVGGIGNQEHEKLSGITGQPIPGTEFNFNAGGYGGLIDQNGVLWSSFPLLRYDPDTGAHSVIGNNYGIGIDPNNGHIWISGGNVLTNETGPSVQGLLELDSQGVVLHVYSGGGVGLCVDANSHVWAATGGFGTVTHLAPNPTNSTLPYIIVGEVGGFNHVRGVAVDANGKIWGADLGGDAARRIDPTLGATNGYPVGQIDTNVDLLPGAAPYTYSDMTGFVSKMLPGTWTVVQDSATPGMPWGTVSWNASTPSNSMITVQVRTADDTNALATSSYVTITNGVPFDNVPSGRYIQVRVKLFSAGQISPTLYDITVCPAVGPDQPPDAVCQNVVTNAPANAYFVSVPPQAVYAGTNNLAASSWSLSLSPSTVFPIGTNSATLTITDLHSATSSCSATITVVDPQPPTIICPPNLSLSTDPGSNSVSSAALGLPSVGDNQGILSVVNDAPALLDVGTHLVTWTATDLSGNTNSCTQTVVVYANQSLSILCPQSVSTNTGPGLPYAVNVGLGTPTVTGAVSTTNDAPAHFDIGLTVVTWKVIDGSGHTNSCLQTVTVADNEPPTITAPANVNTNASPGQGYASNVVLGAPVATNDNSGAVSVWNDAPTQFPIGTTTVIWTAADASGNSATATQLVSVTDSEAPNIQCPTNLTLTVASPDITFSNSSDCATIVGASLVVAGPGMTNTYVVSSAVTNLVNYWSITNAFFAGNKTMVTNNTVEVVSPTNQVSFTLSVSNSQGSCSETVPVYPEDSTSQSKGQQLYSSGGDTVVEILAADAASTCELWLLDSNPPYNRLQYIGLNFETGKVVDVGSLPYGSEVIFGISNRNTQTTFLMGPGSRNPDESNHCAVTTLCPGVYVAAFENLAANQGSDWDFNDCVFRFSGGLTAPAPTNACMIVGADLVAVGVTNTYEGPVATNVTNYWSISGATFTNGATAATNNVVEVLCHSAGTFTLTLSNRLTVSSSPNAWVAICEKTVTVEATNSTPPVVGAQLFSAGGDIIVEILKSDAASTNELWVFNPNSPHGKMFEIATDKQTGTVMDIGSFPVGSEIVFGISNRNTQTTLLMGPGSRNPDGSNHCAITMLCTGVYDVGFEDLTASQGADWDFNDCVFRFSDGVSMVTPTTNDCNISSVTLGWPILSDNYGIASLTNDSPTQFVVGSNQVVWTVVDVSGHTNSCIQSVYVQASPPQMLCPPTVLVATNASSSMATNVSLGTPVLGDSCTGTYTITNDAPASFPVGTNTVTWKACGASLTNTCTQLVIVYTDVASNVAVVITDPLSNEVFDVAQPIVINAEASTFSGVITNLVFYHDGINLIDQTTNGPFRVTWTNASAGAHTLTASAFSSSGKSNTSPAINIIVKSSPPTVTVTNPVDQAVFPEHATVTIRAAATSSTGISNVQFYANNLLLGQTNTSPYNFTWTNVTYGRYALTAVAMDNAGQSGTSTNPLTIIIDALPHVQLDEPTNNAIASAGVPLTLLASASDTDGTVTNVVFTTNSVVFGQASSAPYTLTWTTPAVGTTNTLRAIAYDNFGFSSTSAPITVTIDQAPSIFLTSPTNNAAFGVGQPIAISATTSDSVGIARVELRNGTALIGLLTSPVSNQTYAMTWNSAPAGTNSVVAKAINNLGISATASVTITVTNGLTTTNGLPLVSITQPLNATNLSPGASLTIAATATAASGTITGIIVSANNSQWGHATTVPYSFTTNNLGSGTYNLVAQATDSSGNTGSSFPVAVIVNSPPQVTLLAPSSNSVVEVGTPVTLLAAARDIDGRVAKVDFYADNASISTATSSPYSATWTPGTPCTTSTVFAVATDNVGAVATSSTARVIIIAPSVVAMNSPTNNQVFQIGQPVLLAATASNNCGLSISRVDFYQGSDHFLTMTEPTTNNPHLFQFSWPLLNAGSYTFSAEATDQDGGKTTSSTVHFRVNAPPTVNIISPTLGSILRPGSVTTVSAAISDTDGTVQVVSFFTNSTLWVTIPTNVSSGTVSITTNFPSGLYDFVAVATDNDGGVSTSGVVDVRFDSPPTVTLTNPVNGATNSMAFPVQISALAFDPDGDFRTLRITADGNLLIQTNKFGPGTNAVMNFSWTNAPAGTHNLQATVIDQANNSAVSPIVRVTVTSTNDMTPPSITLGAVDASNTAIVNNQTVSNTLVVTTTATDDSGNISNILLGVDSYLLAYKTGTNLIQYALNTLGLTNGIHTVFAWAGDPSGNVSTNVTLSFNVENMGDTNPPSVFLMALDQTNGIITTAETVSGTISLTVTAADNVAVSKILLGINNSSLNGIINIGPGGAPLRYTLDTTALANGPCQLFAYAYDTAFNCSQTNSLAIFVTNSVTQFITSPSVITDSTPLTVSAAIQPANNWSLQFSGPTAAVAGSGATVATNIDLTGYADGAYTVSLAAGATPLTRTFTVAREGLPIAQIANLTNGQSVTTGAIDLQGAADYPDASKPVSYQILLYNLDGTPVADVTPLPLNGQLSHDGRVTAVGSLGSVNLTTVQNGVYILQLNVFAGQLTATTQIQFILNSPLKIGQFSFSQQDMVIPVSGVPLSVIRTYNSFNPNAGDFGNSWTYAINDLQVQFDEQREDNDSFDGTFSMRAGGGRDVTLTLPDGRRVTFTYSEQVVNGFASYYQAVWTPPPGVTASLKPAPPATGIIDVYGTVHWRDNPYIPLDNYDFPGFVLTTADGTQYTIQRDYMGNYDVNFDGDQTDDAVSVDAYGAAHLSQITDRNGNTIEISTSGVQYVNPFGQTVKSIPFGRNNSLFPNFITDIWDPQTLAANGNSTNGVEASVRYFYDGIGNLTNVTQISSRSPTNVYARTTYVYGLPQFPHFITSIIDPRGVTPMRNLYDDSGRLIGVIDALGKTNSFVNDAASNTETVYDRMGNPTTYSYDASGNVVTTVDALGHVVSETWDGNNNPLTVSNAAGVTSYTYDGNNNRTRVIDPLGHTNSFLYDGNADLLTHTDPLGNITVNQYDGNGNLLSTTMKDAQGNVVSSSSSTYVNGQLTATHNAAGTLTSGFGYDASGNLNSATDANGLMRTFGYDGNGNQTGTTFGAAQTFTDYDSQGRVIRTTDADGNHAFTFYNAIGKTDHTIDKFGNTNSFVYDAAGNLVQTTYPDTTITRTVYDDNARPFLTVDRYVVGNQANGTRTEYDPIGRATNTVRLANVLINVSVDGNGVGNASLSSVGSILSTSYTTYDAVGQVVSRTGADGQTTTYTYYADGQPKDVTDPLTNTTHYVYDAAGRRTAMVDALSHTNRFEYDALGRLSRTIYSDNSFTSNTYNQVGQKIAETDQAGLTTTFAYTDAGQLQSVAKPSVPDPENGGNLAMPTWSYGYDTFGRQVSVTDPKSRVTASTYDAVGRQLTRVLPMGQTETNVYNALGQLWRHYDFKGQREEFAYDSFGRVKAKFFFAVGAAQPTNATCYVYDSLGRVQKIIERSGTSLDTNVCNAYSMLNKGGGGNTMLASLEHGAIGHAAPLSAFPLACLGLALLPAEVRRALKLFYLRGGWRWRSRRGKRRVHMYLSPLWLRAVSLVLMVAVVGTLSPGLDLIPKVRASCAIPSNPTVNDGERTTIFTYDLDGRLTQANTPEGVVNYNYDSTTSRHTSTCTTNSETLYGYDQLGRLKTVTMDKRNGSAISETSTYTYTAIGTRQEIDLPNGGTTTYAYDSLNRLTNLTQKASGNVLLAKYNYTVYATGRRSGATEVLLQADDATYATNTIGWAYDGMSRLTNETYATTLTGISYATAYGYDRVGNRLSEAVAKPTVTNTVTYGYNGNDQLTNEVSTLNGSTKYLYDQNGSLTSKTNATANTGYTFTYSLQNRLQAATVTGVSGGPITTSYLYNDQGIRVRSIPNGTAKYFLNDANNPTGYSQVLEELGTVGGTPSMSYVIGDDLLAQAGASGTPVYLRHDGHGSTRQLDQTGNVVVEQYNYDAYGQSLGTPPTFSSPYATTMLYAGQQFDTSLQHYYLRARYYDASNGRFNQLDPLAGHNGDPQSLHKYVYADTDPVNGVDPSGKQDITGLVAALAIVGILATSTLTIFSGVRHKLSGRVIALQVFQNIAFFIAIAGSILLTGPIAVLAAITVFVSGILGVIDFVQNWPRMDTTDRVVGVLTMITYLAFAGAIGGGAGPQLDPLPSSTSSPIPESYFGGTAIDMRGAPSGSDVTALGYPRNARWFWKQVLAEHPSYFSADNLDAISNGRSPRIDEQWVNSDPKHLSQAPYMNEKLVHHHVEQGPIAVPLPEEVHVAWSEALHPGVDSGDE
jgi:RHS repeat-associated protein